MKKTDEKHEISELSWPPTLHYRWKGECLTLCGKKTNEHIRMEGMEEEAVHCIECGQANHNISKGKYL